MANRTKTTKGASKITKRKPAPKAFGARGNADAEAARQKLREADARTRALLASRGAQVVDMIGGSGRNAVRAELVPLHDALVKVRCCCSELAQLAAELPRLPKSVVRGRWSEDWATAYPQWWDAIQAARALAGSPAVAAIMDVGERRPAEKWTSRTVADLDRLAATHHPMREGPNGLGFIRVGRESLSTDFVPCAAAIATRLVELQSVPKAESVAPKDGGDTVSDSDADSITFSDTERKLLKSMASKVGHHLWSADSLADSARFGNETARRFIARLCDHHLAERPEGERRGARLTTKGRLLAKRVFAPQPEPQD